MYISRCPTEYAEQNVLCLLCFFVKVYCVFLLSAATTWSAPMSCRSSTQRVRSASRSTASHTRWCRSCACSPMWPSTRSSRSTPAGPPSRGTTLTASSSAGVTSLSVCVSQNTNSKMCSAASMWSTLTSCQSSAQHVRSACCSAASPTRWGRTCACWMSETLDMLANEALCQGHKEYSSWPIFQKLYINGGFFSGCDIIVSMYI